MSLEVIEKALAENTEQAKKGFAEIGEIKQKLASVSDRLLDIEQKGPRLRDAQEATGGESPGALRHAIKSALKGDKFDALCRGERSTGKLEVKFSMKALTSLQGSPLSEPAGVNVQPDERPITTQVFKPVRVMESLPQRPTTSNTVGFNRLSFAGETETNAADYQQGEGEEKAEQDLQSNWIDEKVQTIAVHTTLSKQVLNDQEGLATAVDRLLRYGLMEKVDRELINGAGGTYAINGLLTQATPFVSSPGVSPADRIGGAGAALAAAGFLPSVAFVNPIDWFNITSERSTGDGQYVGPGWAAPAAPSVHGLRVIATPSIAIGTALVMDPGIAEIAMRQNPSIEVSREHNGNFTKNLVTVLAEVELALLVMDTAGMLQVDLDSSSGP